MTHIDLDTQEAIAEPAASSPGHSRTILCVDDEPNILSSLRRLFRAGGYRILAAESGEQALALLDVERVDIIISDMRMPVMSGAELLRQVRARWPDITRLLLTGYADITSTITAINEGQIHRYITKPWTDHELLLVVKEALERKALQEDKERLEQLTFTQNEQLKTLNATLEQKVDERTADLALANDRLKKNYFNSIKTFSNLIELRGGQLMGHARKVADLARRTAKAMNLDDAQSHEVFIAALLHDIGQIGLSDQILSTPVSKMSQEDAARYRLHPIFGEQALIGLDDMQAVASLVRSHHERHDGRGFPDGLSGDGIPMGARILAIADTYEDLLDGHFISGMLSPAEARTMIGRGRGTQFDPAVADAFLGLFVKPVPPPTHRPLKLRTDELKPGMVLAVDFLSAEGVLLLAADHVLTADLILRLKTLEQRAGRPVLLAIKHPQEAA